MSIARNPFPPSAVAVFRPEPGLSLTIPTDAVRRATALTDQYLAHGAITVPDGTAAGNVMAIVGEYGTGKTHLAYQLLGGITTSGAKDVHALYLDAPSDTFLGLYRERFIPKLSRKELRRQVAAYFSDIVADELEGSELGAPLAKELRARKIEPLGVVARLGLSETRLLERLTSRLAEVTRAEELATELANPDQFATALTLFLRPEFEATVWDWLAGNPPDPALVERGINRAIDADSLALDAIGVVALLFGAQGQRFVLVIDEMEKILSPAPTPRTDERVLRAFKRLLEQIARTGAFLILGGLPDFLEALPEDIRQRIPVVIRPTRLSTEDAIRYIEDVQQRTSGERELRPFSADVAEYLVELAGGNARKVIRLCYYSYELAASAGTDVTRAIVRDAAREQLEAVTSEGLRSEIERVLDRNGWRFERDKDFATKRKRGAVRTVDFWIPIGDEGAGGAVLLTQSILQKPDADALLARAKPVLSSAQGTQRFILAVVNGYLGETFAKNLDKTITKVLVHDLDEFTERLDATLHGLIERLETSARDATLSTVSERIEQVSRQNSSVNHSLDQLMAAMPTMGALERAVESGLLRFFRGLSARGDTGGGSRRLDSRHPRLQRVFEEVREVLQSNRRPFDEALDGLFAEPERGSEDVYMASSLLAGVKTLLVAEQLIDAFESGVAKAIDTGALGDPKTRWSVGRLCGRFDDVIGHPEFGELVNLEEHYRPELRSPPSSTQAHSPYLYGAMRSLAQRVYEAAGDDLSSY